jgi:cell wall assembly regulator SMI1
LKSQWSPILKKLEALGCLDAASLRDGASLEDIQELETHLGVTFPDSFRDFLAEHDGQDRKPGFGVMYVFEILSVEAIRENWDDWRSLDEEAMNEDCAEFMTSEPPGFVKPLYTTPKWIPIAKDWGGNHFGFDFDPDELGTVGQIIRFGRDEDEKRVMASSFPEFIHRLSVDLERCKWDGENLEWPERD